MKKALAVIVAGTLTLAVAPRAQAGSSADAALALGAFAVLNQLVAGQTVFQQAFPPPALVVQPAPPTYYVPPPAVIYPPPPPPPAIVYTPPPVAYYPSYAYPAPPPYYPRYWRRHHRGWDEDD
jgi:hypothetical protein